MREKPIELTDATTGKRRTYTESQRRRTVDSLEWDMRKPSCEIHMTEEEYVRIWGHHSPQWEREHRVA